MTFIVCPHCKQGFEHVASKRICADCGLGMGRHDKYQWATRNGVQTIIHKDCKVPTGGPGFKEKLE